MPGFFAIIVLFPGWERFILRGRKVSFLLGEALLFNLCAKSVIPSMTRTSMYTAGERYTACTGRGYLPRAYREAYTQEGVPPTIPRKAYTRVYTPLREAGRLSSRQDSLSSGRLGGSLGRGITLSSGRLGGSLGRGILSFNRFDIPA